MINQLYIERLSDGGYKVVCNDLFTTTPPPQDMFPEWVQCVIDVGSCIQVMTQRYLDDCEDEDDAAGVRVGYQPFDMFKVAYNGETRLVPDFMVEGAIMRLASEAGT